MKNVLETGKSLGQAPLAERLRPASWEEYQGLEALDRNLIARLRAGAGRAPSLLLWGPPGCGKTTLARLIGRSFDAEFVPFSAVLGGVKEVREIVAAARVRTKPTILFVDEIHRFNKGQQDAFLPHVEDGTIVLIGATTENPSFYLTAPLLSRLKLVRMEAPGDVALRGVAAAAAGALGISFEAAAVEILVQMAGGDARRLINFVESYAESGKSGSAETEVSAGTLQEYLKDAGSLFYDRSGDEHYSMISAFIKSLRGSSPDAALYWGFRMIASGEDPRFIIRRMIIFASEDIGNADPRALQLATATWQAYEAVGLPEGRIPVAQCITYLATAPKSNRSYLAMHSALAAIEREPRAAVPMHLRNAPTGLMKDLGLGKGYEYPHDTPHGYAAGVQYLPDAEKSAVYYRPTERGYEKMIQERMALRKALDEEKKSR